MRFHLLVPILAACTGATGADRWAGTVDTLPNGAIRVSNPALGVWGEDAGWRLVPALAIGGDEVPGPTMFEAVSGLEVDDAGRIYVLDRQANELRIFGPDGAHLRTVGRSGGGPGEYSNANGLCWLAPDTLVVIDQRGNRYTVLGSGGEFVRTIPRGLGFYGWVFRGGCLSRRIYEQAYVGRDPEVRHALVGTSLDAAVSGVPHDTVLLPAPDVPAYQAFSVRTANAGMSMSVPFAPGLVYRLDGSGNLWHGYGNAFRLFRTSLGGDTLNEFVLAAEPTPVTAEEVAAWEAGESVKRFRDMGGHLDMSRIPSVKPYFEEIQLDDDGNLWVTVPAGPSEAEFRVFDSGGRYLGPVDIALRVYRYVPPVVRNGRLYVVASDELEVQRIQVFTIDR